MYITIILGSLATIKKKKTTNFLQLNQHKLSHVLEELLLYFKTNQ